MGDGLFKGRILFLMQESRMGGIEHNSLQLAHALRQKGTEVAFLCPEKGDLTELLERGGFAFDCLPRPRFSSTSFRLGSRTFWNPLASLYNFVMFFPLALRITAWLGKNRPSLVVTKGLLANFYGSLGARIAGLPVLWDMQEIVSPDKAFGLFRWILNQWGRVFSSHVTVPARAVGGQFDRVIRNKMTVIPNGVSLERFHPNVDRLSFRHELGLGPDVILIGHVARWTYWKGQREFVKAVQEVARVEPDVRFVLVGAPVFESDAYEREVKKLADQLRLGERLFFRGYRSDLEQVLAALDVYVHSSIEPEGCPLTLICAMAMEKPVIVTRVPGNSEIVEDQVSGVFVQPQDPTDLAQGMLCLIRAPERRHGLGRAARLRVCEKFSLVPFAQKTLAVMERLKTSRIE